MSKYGPQNSWLFCSLNNIPDGVTACADLVLQECHCTVSCWSVQFAYAWHYTAVRLATTCFFLEILL